MPKVPEKISMQDERYEIEIKIRLGLQKSYTTREGNFRQLNSATCINLRKNKIMIRALYYTVYESKT